MGRSCIRHAAVDTEGIRMARGHGGLDEARDLQREAVHIWEALIRLSYMQERLSRAGCTLGSITLRPPSVEGGDWLGVVRCEIQTVWYVGFISGREVANVLHSMVSKLESNSMVWKEDQYANKRAGA